MVKVKGEINWADALTKHVNGDALKRHSKYVGIEISSSRHEIMPELGDRESMDGENDDQDED